jgi:hypothetical protein
MYEHDKPYEGFPVVALSLEEDDTAPDTLRDKDIARKLFGDLNHDLLGPLHDGIIIVISDFDE